MKVSTIYLAVMCFVLTAFILSLGGCPPTNPNPAPPTTQSSLDAMQSQLNGIEFVVDLAWDGWTIYNNLNPNPAQNLLATDAHNAVEKGFATVQTDINNQDANAAQVDLAGVQTGIESFLQSIVTSQTPATAQAYRAKLIHFGLKLHH